MRRFWALGAALAVVLIVAGILYFRGGSDQATERTAGSGSVAGVSTTGRQATDGSAASSRADLNQDEGRNPLVTIKMESGSEIQIELYPDVAPNTVRNFISLARSGFYNGTTFHRVIPGFMIQGGDPRGDGTGGPGYSIRGEFTANGFRNDVKHERGVVSMARARSFDSAGSQFFIMVAAAPHLDGQYAAFGRVISGMEEVDRIVSVPRDAMDKPLEPQRIASVTVETFGEEYPEPEKM